MPLIVHLSMHYRPICGGQEVYISNLIKLLSGNGWRSVVIQPYRGITGPDVAQVVRIPKVAGIFPSFDELQFSVFAALSCPHLLDKADVILSHYATSAAFISMFPKWRKKLIILSHGIEWNVDRMNLHDRVRERNAKRLFSASATVANDTDYLRRMGLDIDPGTHYFSEVAKNVWFVPNCVDCNYFQPKPSRDSSPLVLVPRQICEDRGIHLAIEAFAELIKVVPEAHMHIIGPKRSEIYYSYCISLIERFDLFDRVKFLPYVPNRNMVPYYQKAHVTLIPTLRREGTSLSALESMACGTPVVLTNIAGLKDIPGIHTELQPFNIASALKQVLDNHQRETKTQLSAVHTHFTEGKWINAWDKLLTQFIRRVKQSPS